MAKIANEESHLPDKKEYSQEEINSIDVYYCADCLSLRIRSTEEDLFFCDHCFCTNIERTNIKEWEKLYIERYKHSYLTKKITKHGK